MAATTTLLAPNGRRYVVERGVVDDRSALHLRMVTVTASPWRSTRRQAAPSSRTSATTGHSIIFVKASDGRLIDIGGARDPSDLTPGGVLSFVDAADVDPLTASLGWVPPATDLAADWVSSVVERVERNRRITVSAASRTTSRWTTASTFTSNGPNWRARVRLRRAWPATSGTPSWARCSVVTIKADENGERLIDFAPAAFGVHARRFEALLRQSPDAVYANVLDPVEPEQPLAPPASA